MNYADLKTNFQSYLNRGDVTPSQVALFISQAITRIQRSLRTPASEKIVLTTVPNGFTTYAIPGDYLDIVQISVNGRELTRVPLTLAKELARVVGTPTVFARDGASFVIGNLPAAGDQVQLTYHADFSDLSADSDSNWLTGIAPDLIIWGAMVFAATFFQDPRITQFELQFQQALAELNDQAIRDELTNAQIIPGFCI